MNLLTKYHGHLFDDCGTSCSDDFRNFSKNFKTFLKKNLPEDCEIVKHSCGHYFCSGFVVKNEKCVYYSFTWDRFSRFDAYSASKGVLYRKCKDTSDYQGGVNNFASFSNLSEEICRMLK